MMASYVSEVTQFINQYKKDHPNTEKRQREGRGLLWDKEIDLSYKSNTKPLAYLKSLTYITTNKSC